MRKLLLVLLAYIAVATAVDLESLQAVPASTTRFNGPGGPRYPVAFHGNTMVTWGVYLDATNTSVPGYMVFREKNGQYVNVANFQADETPSYVFNNGKWMGGQYNGQNFRLFQLDANDQVINQTFFALNSDVQYTTLLSDNSFVYLDQTYNFTTLTQVSNGSWVTLPNRLAARNFYSNDNTFKFAYIDDTSLVYFNYTSILIHARQSDGSWLQTDVFAYRPPFEPQGSQFNMHYNGIDTVILVYPNVAFNNTPTSGIALFITKINNDWKYEVITPYQIGFVGSTLFGYGGIAALSSSMIVIPAFAEGTPSGPKRGVQQVYGVYGKLLVVERQNNSWVPWVKIYSTDSGYLGSAVGVTDNHVVTTLFSDNNLPFTFYSVPRCVFSPINATCFDLEVSTCQLDVSNNTEAFTVNQCADYTQTSVSAISFNNNSLSVTFEFDRVLSPTVTCSSVLSCPVPPSTTVIVAPSSKSVSSASIMSSAATLVMSLFVALF